MATALKFLKFKDKEIARCYDLTLLYPFRVKQGYVQSIKLCPLIKVGYTYMHTNEVNCESMLHSWCAVLPFLDDN